MNEKVLNIIGAKIEDVASSIANSKTGKKIFPGTEQLHNEINSRVASYVNQGTHYKVFKNSLGDAASNTDKEIQKIFETRFDDDILNSMNLDSSKVNELISLRNSVTQSNMDNVFESMRNIASDDKFSGYIDDIVKPQIATDVRGLDKDTVVPSIGKVNYALNVPRAYYDSPDKSTRRTRIAATAGAVAGVAIGGRFLAGGTLTNDSYGKKDIVGIPFI